MNHGQMFLFRKLPLKDLTSSKTTRMLQTNSVSHRIDQERSLNKIQLKTVGRPEKYEDTDFPSNNQGGLKQYNFIIIGEVDKVDY